MVCAVNLLIAVKEAVNSLVGLPPPTSSALLAIVGWKPYKTDMCCLQPVHFMPNYIG